MEPNNKYIIVPADIIDGNEHHKYSLPIFLFLQCRRGADYRCQVTYKHLMEVCGYSTANRSNINKNLPVIHKCLMELRELGYIHQFCNAIGFQPLEEAEFEELAASDLFCIEMNPLMADNTGFGFAALSVYDYCVLYEQMTQYNIGTPFWKILTLYMYIYRRIWKRKGYMKEDRANIDETIALENPEYVFIKQETISHDLGAGFSKNIVSKIIVFLEEINMLHTADFYYGTIEVIDKHGIPRAVPQKRGTFFVRDSNAWRLELEGARIIKTQDYKRYYNSKEVKVTT